MSLKRVLLKRFLLPLGRAPHTAPPLLGSSAYPGPITVSERKGKSDYFNGAGNSVSVSLPGQGQGWERGREGLVILINL